MQDRQFGGRCGRAMLTNQWHAANGDASVRGAAVRHLPRPVSVARARRMRDGAQSHETGRRGARRGVGGWCGHLKPPRQGPAARTVGVRAGGTSRSFGEAKCDRFREAAANGQSRRCCSGGGWTPRAAACGAPILGTLPRSGPGVHRRVQPLGHFVLAASARWGVGPSTSASGCAAVAVEVVRAVYWRDIERSPAIYAWPAGDAKLPT